MSNPLIWEFAEMKPKKNVLHQNCKIVLPKQTLYFILGSLFHWYRNYDEKELRISYQNQRMNKINGMNVLVFYEFSGNVKTISIRKILFLKIVLNIKYLKLNFSEKKFSSKIM
jgi:hypothetical protein